MTGGPAEHARRAADPVDLIQRMARGDAVAFADLYDETSASVYGIALSVVRSPQLAETLTQEVYADAWRTAARYDPSEVTVLAWLISMAHRHIVERVRTMSQEAVPDRFPGLDGHHRLDRVNPAGGGSWPDAERARRALCLLSPAHREAVTLAYFGGYSQTEVARMLGQPLGTVRASIREGMIALSAAMGVGL